MSEEQQAAVSQAETSSEGQAPKDIVAGNEASQEEAQGQPSQEEAASDLEGLSKAELIKRLEAEEGTKRKANKESESYRKRLRQYEQQEEKRRKEQLSQTESLQEENQNLNSELESLRGQVKRANFERAFGLPEADLAWHMLSDLGVEAEYDDDLHVTNIDEIVKAAKQKKPRIWGNGSANGGERSDPPAAQGGDVINSLFRSNRSTGRRR